MNLPREVFDAENRYAAAARSRPRPCWSISLLEGDSLASLAPARGCAHPAVHAADVHDVAAGFVADPFLLRRDGRFHLFFEIHDRVRDRGVIGLATSADARAWRYERVVLDEPHHLSYPFVFEHGGAVYLMPESHQTDEVALYAAEEFPSRWRRAATLIRGARYVDPTLVTHDGVHYLFVGEAFKGVLRLFVANAIAGPWREHPRSPIVTADTRHARPAGRFVNDGAGWVRLAQSTEPVYGAFVSAFRITALDPHTYAEAPMAPYPLLRPGGRGWNAHAMHHLDAMRTADGGWLAVADGLELRRRWPRRRARSS
jgi:hypothetical protein